MNDDYRRHLREYEEGLRIWMIFFASLGIVSFAVLILLLVKGPW